MLPFKSRESPSECDNSNSWPFNGFSTWYIYMKKTLNSQHNWNQFSLFLFFCSPIRMESDCFNTTRKTGLEQIDMKSSSKRKLARARFFSARLLVFVFFYLRRFSSFNIANRCASFAFFISWYTFLFSCARLRSPISNAIYLVYWNTSRVAF